MARKREISFFTDIQSDEKFEEFLSQNLLLGKSKTYLMKKISNQNFFLSQLVLDVYQEMFGPCVSLHSTLEQEKVSMKHFYNFQNLIVTKFREWKPFLTFTSSSTSYLQLNWSYYKTCTARKIFDQIVRFQVSLSDSDSLQLATCNADKIEKLKRFHGKSLPTIVFCKVSTVSYLQIESRIIKK